MNTQPLFQMRLLLHRDILGRAPADASPSPPRHVSAESPRPCALPEPRDSIWPVFPPPGRVLHARRQAPLLAQKRPPAGQEFFGKNSYARKLAPRRAPRPLALPRRRCRIAPLANYSDLRPTDRRTRVFEEEFRTYDIDAPEVRALQRAMPQETFALVEGLMGRWQQAGMPLRPARRGFALQAPHGERLTTVAWVYAPDRRHPAARIEVALDLLLRRGVDAEQIDQLRDDLTRFPTHVPWRLRIAGGTAAQR